MIARYSKIALLAFACFLVTAANAAETGAASDCSTSETEDTGHHWRIRTVVMNETHKTFHVVMSRDGKEVDSKTITYNDPRTSHTMMGGNTKLNEVGVQVNITGFESLDPVQDRTTVCNYRVNYEDEDATWSLPTDSDLICKNGIEVACEDCELECKKVFDSLNQRWTTTFTISD